MNPFEYQTPTTLEQATALLARPGAYPLAGGTDLLVKMRYRRLTPTCLVDLKHIPALTRIVVDENGLLLGAAVTCADLVAHPDVRQTYPGLIDAIAIIGGTAIQNRATVGGNLCNAAPSADSAPALIVHNAQAVIAGPHGERTLAVSDFCVAPGQTALAPGELLVAIRVPPPPPRSSAAYLRFTPRHEMDIAVAGAAAWLTLTEKGTIADARIALGAVAPTPLPVTEAAQALIGRQPEETAFATAAHLAQEAARPIDDVRGSAAQRRHLIGVLVRRTLRIALERAQSAM